MFMYHCVFLGGGEGEGNFVSAPALCIKMNKLLSEIFFLSQLL